MKKKRKDSYKRVLLIKNIKFDQFQLVQKNKTKQNKIHINSLFYK